MQLGNQSWPLRRPTTDQFKLSPHRPAFRLPSKSSPSCGPREQDHPWSHSVHIHNCRAIQVHNKGCNGDKSSKIFQPQKCWEQTDERCFFLQSAVGPLGASLSRDVIDAEEVFEMIRHINDPEHPLTLEQLKVVSVRLRLDLALRSLKLECVAYVGRHGS